MTIETLVVTTGQHDHSLLKTMNIQTDAIIGNQCDKNEIEKFSYNDKNVKWLSLCEKGVGLNRNNVLMRSTADICVFADDDMVFHDGYEDIVKKAFDEHPNADIIIFNLDTDSDKYEYTNTKAVKINHCNYGRYGAARIAFRRRSIFMAGICFNLMFGGGAEYSSGEDSIFLYNCLQKKLNIVAVPVSISTLTSRRESTWFMGYNDKFFFDKGVLYFQLYHRFAGVVALYNCIRHKNGRYKDYGWKYAYKKMLEGIKGARINER